MFCGVSDTRLLPAGVHSAADLSQAEDTSNEETSVGRSSPSNTNADQRLTDPIWPHLTEAVIHRCAKHDAGNPFTVDHPQHQLNVPLLPLIARVQCKTPSATIACEKF